MTSHFAILPNDILQLLTSSLAQNSPRDNKEPLRILRLPHPRTGLPALFFPYELPHLSTESPLRSGILEVQAVSPHDERSWFLDEDVVADGRLLSLSPIDPVFLLLPIMQKSRTADQAKFRTWDDLCEVSVQNFGEDLSDSMREDIILFCSLQCVKPALRQLSEVQYISDNIIVYRYSPERLLKYLQAKVARLHKSKAFEDSQTVTRNLAKDGLMEDGKEALLDLGRLRACCDLLAQYLPNSVRDSLFASYDFTTLQKRIDAVREEAMAKAAAVAPPPKKGRGKAAAEKVEKATTATKPAGGTKRKAAKVSHGVEALKKANTNGMSKISSFFNKS